MSSSNLVESSFAFSEPTQLQGKQDKIQVKGTDIFSVFCLGLYTKSKINGVQIECDKAKQRLDNVI